MQVFQSITSAALHFGGTFLFQAYFTQESLSHVKERHDSWIKEVQIMSENIGKYT